MSLANLTVSELQTLLMEETKKLTTALRQGFATEEKEKISKRIEEIIKILDEKKTSDDHARHH